MNDSHTNMCGEHTAVKISACALRRRPASGSNTMPMKPKSSWHSAPGSPSAIRTVAAARPNPQRSAQKRTVHPCLSCDLPQARI